MHPLCQFIDIGVPWGKLYRKSFIEKHELFFNPQLRRNQDNIFNIHAFYYAGAVRYLDKPLYIYDITHFGGISRQMSISQPMRFTEAQYDAVQQHGLLEEPAIARSYIECMLTRFFKFHQLVRQESFSDYMSVIHEMRLKEAYAVLFRRVVSLKDLDISENQRRICYMYRYHLHAVLYIKKHLGW